MDFFERKKEKFNTHSPLYTIETIINNAIKTVHEKHHKYIIFDLKVREQF